MGPIRHPSAAGFTRCFSQTLLREVGGSCPVCLIGRVSRFFSLRSGGCLVIWTALLFDNCIGKRSADGVVLADHFGTDFRVCSGMVEENIDALRR